MADPMDTARRHVFDPFKNLTLVWDRWVSERRKPERPEVVCLGDEAEL